MKRTFGSTVAALIIAATLTACGNGDGAVNPPLAQEQYEWVALEQLLLPTPLPPSGTYALLVGQFAVMQDANRLHFRVTASGYRSSIIPVVDKDGLHWFFVSAGSFDSLDAARTSRAPISTQLGISEPLSIILLPPEK